MFSCSTHDFVFIFTNMGKVFKLKGYQIPESSRTSKGLNVVNLLPLEQGETVSAMVKIPKEEERAYLCMVTRNGIIKRTPISAYDHIRKTGIIAINLDEGDEPAAWQSPCRLCCNRSSSPQPCRLWAHRRLWSSSASVSSRDGSRRRWL